MKSVKRLLSLALMLAMVLSLAPLTFAEGPSLSIKLQENAAVELSGGAITVTDTDDNNDVWSSKVLLDAGMELVPGEQYKISFDLSGENGAGEFFLCKSENLDDRYDTTFANDLGDRSITFTAEGDKVFVGMQVGNLGNGHSVTANISAFTTLTESENPALLRTENCAAAVTNGTITATDTSDNNDVWNSKVLYDGGALEVGKTYDLTFDLSGDNGVGEFFVCKSPNLNDRYDATFTSGAGSRTVTFVAESDRLYVGMQMGNLGKGNSVTAGVQPAKETAPMAPPKFTAQNCRVKISGNSITVTDNDDNNDVWNSKVIYDAGIRMEIGKQYEIHFSLSGEEGVGEFFLLKSKNIDDRYHESFFNANGEKTVVITAESTRAYIGMQLGNVGKDNKVKATILDVKEYDPENPGDPRMLTAENCTYEVRGTQITVTDTSDNNDVWNSKVLYFLGNILERGSIYGAKFNLFGAHGVGEFFFLKSANMDDRYSFDNTEGDHVAKFIAEDSKLYAGFQFGNIGKDNTAGVLINGIYRLPGLLQSNENSLETIGANAVTLTDLNDNGDVWNSKALYKTNVTLVPGRTYTATFTLTGADGVGEFFFLKSADLNDRYSFDNTAGQHTITFTADGTELYFGAQFGNIGNGHTVTIRNLSVSEVTEQQEPQSGAKEAAPVDLFAPMFWEEPAFDAE